MRQRWQNIKQRCYNPKNRGYPNYGGRGIQMCDEWRDSFERFYADMGDPPEGHSIERIDVHGNYEPGNCRWANAKEQARNTRRSKFVVMNGKTLHLLDAIAMLERSAFRNTKRRRARPAEQLPLV